MGQGEKKDKTKGKKVGPYPTRAALSIQLRDPDPAHTPVSDWSASIWEAIVRPCLELGGGGHIQKTRTELSERKRVEAARC